MLLCYTVAWGTITTPLENCHGCQIEGVRNQRETPSIIRVRNDVVLHLVNIWAKQNQSFRFDLVHILLQFCKFPFSSFLNAVM